MKLIKNIVSSFGIAIARTFLEILHKKFGGFASGGRVSDAHSLDELMGMSSYFLTTFSVIFSACFVYFRFFNNKKYLKLVYYRITRNRAFMIMARYR